jgi:protein TonB
MAPPKVEPSEEPVKVAPAAGQSSERVKRVEASWQKALVSHLNRFKRYPDAARARGSQGSVLVEFTIDRSGKVVASRVLRHSGWPLLDEEAIAVLQRASPLPGPPAEMTGELFPLTLPIQFRIK